MQRRTFLATGIATVMMASVAGCLGDDSQDDPEGTVEAYFAALDDGDIDQINDLIHPDSPEGDIAEEELEELAEVDISVVEVSTVEEDDDEAIVEATFEIEMEGFDEPFEETDTFVLRTYEGDWYLYDEA